MRVLVSVDMEGCAGVAGRHQTRREGGDYERARRLMTAEASAAVAGAFDAGAEQVLVADSHGDMDNVLPEELDPRASLLRGSPRAGLMVAGVQDADVLVMVGYHAAAGSAAGVYAHTYSGASFAEVRLDGRAVGEAELNARAAAESGAATALVTGDSWACEEVRAACGTVRTLSVKTGLTGLVATSVSPQQAQEAIRSATADALGAPGTWWRPTARGELQVEVDVLVPRMTELAALVPGTVRTGARTLSRRCRGPREAVEVLTVWFCLAAAAA